MKHAFFASAVLGFSMAAPLQAATILGAHVGIDYLRLDTSGAFAQSGQGMQSSSYDVAGLWSYWAALEHPLPFVPNVKIRENRLDQQGQFSATSFSFLGQTFNGSTINQTDVSNTDFVLYYELLDNDLVSLDAGLAYKMMHGAMQINTLSADIDSGIMMGYASGRVGLPGIGLYGFAELMQGINEVDVHDYAVGLGWQFDNLIVDTRLRVGYREFLFDVTNFSGLNADLKLNGYFAGVELYF